MSKAQPEFVIGIDPGPMLADCFPLIYDGVQLKPVALYLSIMDLRDSVAVVEWPVVQGPNRWNKSIHATLETACQLRIEIAKHCPVYCVPANEIRRVVCDYHPKRNGKFDPYWRRYIKDVLKMEVGRGTALNSTHARDAFAAALWGWRVALHTPELAKEYVYQREVTE